MAGGPWNNTRGRSLCLQVGVVVGGGALEQHTGPQSLFAGQAQSNIQGFVLFVRLVIWADILILNLYIFWVFSFFPIVVGTPPVTTTTGPQSLFAGHGEEVSGQLVDVISWVVIYSTSSCCGEEVSGQLVDIISWVVIHSTSSCCGEEVSGQLVDIISWVVIYSTSSCCGEEVSGQLVDIISWVVIYSTSSCCGEEVSGQLVDIISWVVIYSRLSCCGEEASCQLVDIFLWVVIYSASSCEWSSIQHHLVSCFCSSVVDGGGGQNNTRGHSLCL